MVGKAGRSDVTIRLLLDIESVNRLIPALASVCASRFPSWGPRYEDCFWLETQRYGPEPKSVARIPCGLSVELASLLKAIRSQPKNQKIMLTTEKQ